MAYVVYEPNRPQENAQPVHGSGAEVQDHDPIRNFIEEGLRRVRPLKTVVLGKRAVNCYNETQTVEVTICPIALNRLHS